MSLVRILGVGAGESSFSLQDLRVLAAASARRVSTDMKRFYQYTLF